MVPAAIPFALAAAFFPAGLAVVLWLLASPPRLRRGVVYLSGAATSTIASGILMLALLREIARGTGRPRPAEGAVQVLLGTVFLLVAGGLLLRRPRLDKANERAHPPRLQAGGYIGIFLLGMAMWTPSLAYVGAIDLIVDSGLSLWAQVLNLLLVDVIVLSSVEVPLLLYVFAPSEVIRVITTMDTWVRRFAWQLGAITAGCGGIFLVVRGWLELA
jgi:hypothetical protein